MTSLKTITQKFNAWRRYRDALRGLSSVNNRGLHDIGIDRGSLAAVARQAANG
jgi:uncharacterized protein YjiS (DUF1127 family)